MKLVTVLLAFEDSDNENSVLDTIDDIQNNTECCEGAPQVLGYCYEGEIMNLAPSPSRYSPCVVESNHEIERLNREALCRRR